MKFPTAQGRNFQPGDWLHLILIIFLLAAHPAGAAPPESPADIRNAKVQAAIDIRDWHDAQLMTRPGVLGSGIGRTEDGSLVIKLFTKRAGIPNLPSRLSGIPVQIEVTGPVFALEGEVVDPTARFERPVPIGVSAGHREVTAGTIGARVRDSSGNLYALSNNHILANSNDARTKRDVVIQPGSLDGGSSPDDNLGTLHAFVPIDFSGGNNDVDAAIALIDATLLGNATPDGGYGVPSSETLDAYLGQPVQKCGRTTGCTYGEVSELSVTLNVCYEGTLLICTKVARFVNQVAISSPTPFSSGGDSGSLIVTDDTYRNPVALLFANSSTRTFANPIDAVLASLDIMIDGDSSTPGGDTSPPPPPATFSLTASGYKAKGLHKAELSWSGTTALSVDIWRNGGFVGSSTPNSNTFTDNIDQRGSGDYRYQVCEPGTDLCSNEASVSF